MSVARAGLVLLFFFCGAWFATKAADKTGDLPDSALTPGAIAEVDRQAVCQPGYSAGMRHRDEHLRNKVFTAYGVASRDRSSFVLDWLVPASLGGFSSRPGYTI
jgi:hypothetical protein